nr:hypothetical protein [Arthrobacter sp. FW305-BF8]
MPPTGFYVDYNGASILKRKQVLRDAWLTSADRRHDIPSGCRAMR